MMMNFTLSNQVQIPAVGIGTFMMTPDLLSPFCYGYFSGLCLF